MYSCWQRKSVHRQYVHTTTELQEQNETKEEMCAGSSVHGNVLSSLCMCVCVCVCVCVRARACA